MSAHLTCEPRVRQLPNGIMVPGHGSLRILVFMPKNIPVGPGFGIGYSCRAGWTTFLALLEMPLHPAMTTIADIMTIT